jgi:hypothetical protein
MYPTLNPAEGVSSRYFSIAVRVADLFVAMWGGSGHCGWFCCGTVTFIAFRAEGGQEVNGGAMLRLKVEGLTRPISQGALAVAVGQVS